MFTGDFPTTNVSWQDNSGASTDVLYSAATDGLNVPFFFILAERGVPGAISFGGAAELTPVFGATTFSETSAFFNPATQFMGTAMAGQGVEAMRLVDPDAKTANMVLQATVTPGNITQYVVDASGARTVDANGNYIPQTQSDGVTPVTSPGLVIKWSVRPLANGELFDTLTVKTQLVNGVTSTIYPIMGFEMTSPGLYGNWQGFQLYSTGTTESTVAEEINSVLYRFVPQALASSISTTPGAIVDALGAQYNDVSFKTAAVYTPTATNYAFNYVLGNSYTDPTSGDNVLPYNVHVYGANIGTIGTAVLGVSPELGAIDPYMIDLIAGADMDGNFYKHLQIDDASADIVNSAAVNYATGGTDGDTSFEMLQTLIVNWLSGTSYGEFTNVQQHPMTHFSDPGFSIETKYALLNMLDLRDNFKIDLATQDVSLVANTQAQDVSVGQALMFRAQLHPESVINGVGCTRVGIYAHTSTLVSGSPYSGLLPFNLNRLIQRRNLDGGTFLKGSSGGLPNSAVTIFRKPNWVDDNKTSQALTWANSINTVRHADRTTIFYPSLRTVYPNDTSLLSDDEISDRLCYMIKIVRRVWAIYAGVRGVPSKLFARIQNDINNALKTAFANDNINVAATVFQTAQDENLGAQVSVNLAVTGNFPLRTMNFNIVVGRMSS